LTPIIILSPFFLVLAANLLIAAFFCEFTFLSGGEAIWKAALRYLRLSLNLCLPLLLLPIFCKWLRGLVNRPSKGLVVLMGEEPEPARLKIWLVRPFQGIGLAMLLAAKILSFFQGYLSVALSSATVLPPGQFSLNRLFWASGLGVLAALILSLMWTLDDLGIRYQNDRTGEIRLMGKYLGVILPIIFGFYGFLQLLADVPFIKAVSYIFQMTVILYPPFGTLAGCHSLYVRRYRDLLLGKLGVVKE